MSSDKSQWPGNGRWRETIPPSCKPAIVFIHQYGGNRSSTHRHQDMVLDFGYNCFSFNLNTRLKETKIPDWADALEEALDAVEGPKILYSFSFPSVSVPTLLARGRREDVRAWVCDGGPFCEIWRCYWNLMTYLNMGNAVTRFLRSGYNYFAAGGPLYDGHVREALRRMQPLPVFSIRNTHDPLVPPRAIDKFFALNPELNIQRLQIESSGHLDGIAVQPELYKESVRGFLDSVR